MVTGTDERFKHYVTISEATLIVISIGACGLGIAIGVLVTLIVVGNYGG